MPFSSGLLPMKLGTAETAVTGDDFDFLETKLGYLYEINGKIYRLVKAAAEITSPAKKCLVTAASSGVPTWAVNTTTTAGNYLAAGIVPTEYTATIASGSYFFLQVSGAATAIAETTIAAGAIVGAAATAGEVDDASVSAGVGAIGVTMEAGSDSADMEIFLKGLL